MEDMEKLKQIKNKIKKFQTQILKTCKKLTENDPQRQKLNTNYIKNIVEENAREKL